MKRLKLFLLMLPFLPIAINAQNGFGSMAAQPMTSFYDACPTSGYTREAVLETYSTSFTHKGEQYMLSYDSNIIVGNGSERLPWTRIDEEDIRIYSREIFIYKRQEDHWTKWSRSLLRSVTNGFNYIEYGHPGKAFPLDNGWIILELQHYIRSLGESCSLPLFVLLCPIKSEDGTYYFDDYTFSPNVGAYRRVKEVVKEGHKKYAIRMNDETSIALTFFLERNASGTIDLFEIKDEKGSSSSSTTSRFSGELY